MRKLPVTLSLVCLVVLSALEQAFAHTLPHDTLRFQSGFAHPLSGWDHILSMLGVGMIAFEQQRLKTTMAAFIAGMSGGWLLAQTIIAWSSLEGAIYGGLLGLGLIMLFNRQIPMLLAFIVFAVIGGVHGHAHGTDFVSLSQPLSYLAGFLVASTVLLVSGYGLQSLVQKVWNSRKALMVSGAIFATIASYHLLLS